MHRAAPRTCSFSPCSAWLPMLRRSAWPGEFTWRSAGACNVGKEHGEEDVVRKQVTRETSARACMTHREDHVGVGVVPNEERGLARRDGWGESEDPPLAVVCKSGALLRAEAGVGAEGSDDGVDRRTTGPTRRTACASRGGGRRSSDGASRGSHPVPCTDVALASAALLCRVHHPVPRFGRPSLRQTRGGHLTVVQEGREGGDVG